MNILEQIASSPTIAISILGSLTALSSLAISFSSYRRDQGRLDVSIGVWKVADPRTMQPTDETYIRISMVNSGRRPIVIDSLGGFPWFWRPRGVLNYWMPTWFPIVGFFLADPLVQQQILDGKGEYKMLTEGQKLTVTVPIKKSAGQANKSWDSVHVFYVGDSTGKCHFVPRRLLRKFKKDIGEFFSA